MIASWPCPFAQGKPVHEYALAFDRQRAARLLVLPPLFDEANRMRRLLAEVMRRLDKAGIDSFLPDLPGCNESLQPLTQQNLDSWRAASRAAADHFRASHVLAVRAGAILLPPGLPGWRYAPVSGANALRALMRARMIAAREAGSEERMEDMANHARKHGIELAGYAIGPAMFRDLENAQLPDPGGIVDIMQETIGGSGLWLRAEASFDPAQADGLAAYLAIGMQS